MEPYITSLNLQTSAVAPEATDETVWRDYAAGASRLFDQLCEVRDGFFAKTDGVAAARSFRADPIDMLRLDPFIEGSVTAVEVDGVALAADAYRLAGRPGAQYLIQLTGDFADGALVEVTAQWGFSEIPAQVATVVTELGNYLWRQRDPMFAKISDVEIETNFSPATAAAIASFRAKYRETL